MLDFIYDSLDTVKKLKFPTVKQIAQLTGAIFGLVIIAGLYFILADTIFSEAYKVYYSAMTKGEAMVLEMDEEAEDDAIENGVLVNNNDIEAVNLVNNTVGDQELAVESNE